MKVLHLFPYLPTPANFGGAMRVYHLLKHLAANHDVTVAGYCERGDINMFREEFPGLRGRHFIDRNTTRFRRLYQMKALFTDHSYWYTWTRSKELQKTLDRLVERTDYDVILTEFTSMGHFRLDSDAVKVLDAHNVEYDNFRRMSGLNWSFVRKKFYEREYRKSYREEIEAVRRQDAIFTTSERDGAIFEKDLPGLSRYVIPNGVDMAFFRTGGVTPAPWTMVFTGAMSYLPNSEGIIYFLDSIFPLIQKVIPQAKVYVVGGKPPARLLSRQSDSVIITGFVEDVRPYIDEASVYVVPLTMGGGTRLKVVEAMSMRIPIVSTSIGCEGIDVADEEHLLVRDEPEAFAEGVVQLMKDRRLQEKLTGSGYDLVKKRYDWKRIGYLVDEALQELSPAPEADNGSASVSSGVATGRQDF